MHELHENRVHLSLSHVSGCFECKMCGIDHTSLIHAWLAGIEDGVVAMVGGWAGWGMEWGGGRQGGVGRVGCWLD